MCIHIQIYTQNMIPLKLISILVYPGSQAFDLTFIALNSIAINQSVSIDLRVRLAGKSYGLIGLLLEEKQLILIQEHVLPG